MLTIVSPGVPMSSTKPLSPMLAPLIDAASDPALLRRLMLDIVTKLGFDSFMYGMSMAKCKPDNESRGYVWTTLPKEWVELYDRNAYVEVDPRLTHTFSRTAPFIWDRTNVGSDFRVLQFLTDAARFGVCSGVVFSFQDPTHARIIVAINSTILEIDARRRTEIESKLGDLLLLATEFHDFFMAQLIGRAGGLSQHVARLSSRELQCLQMAANGMTSADIGIKLGITERTANFHFGNIIGKLDVLNRHEAIAKAVATGLIVVE